ncbi:MAG: HlyD family efflux transporter periplasmic adaptor subunit [Alphaproteobacteria bacterium]|nr:HlyD family efflux transporter periplasmic adaptor subunit [Alphaproteobacteria bacterium]
MDAAESNPEPRFDNARPDARAPDLRVTEIIHPKTSRRHYLVEIPGGRGTARFGEEEWFLCRAMTEGRDFDSVSGAFAARFGLAMPRHQWDAFAAELARLGLLAPPPEAPPAADPLDDIEDDVAPPPAAAKAPGRVGLFDPNAVLGAAAALLGPLRSLVWLLIPGMAVTVLASFHHQGEIARQFALAIGPNWFLIHLVLGFLVISLVGRLMQGVVIRGFGADVSQLGLRLTLALHPRVFIDRSAVRGLSRPAQLWIWATPLLVKLAIFQVGLLGWLLFARSGSTLSNFLLVLGNTSLGAFLFTANPLWPADGQRLLGVWLEQPKLRDRAFRLLWLRLTGGSVPEAMSAGEAAGLTSFAVASALWLGFVVVAVILFAGMALENRFQGAGAAIFLALLAIFLWWLRVNVTARRNRGRAAAVAQPRRIGLGQVVWLALAVALGVAAFQPYAYETGGGFTLQPAKRAEVRARFEGQVTQVMVEEGQWVEAGDLVATLSDWELKAQLAATEAQLAQARADLDLLRQGPKPEAVDKARKEVSRAEVAARFAKLDAARAADLLRTSAISRKDADAAQGALQEAEAGLATAQAELALVSAVARQPEFDAAEAKVRQLDSQRSYWSEQVGRARLVAPISGRVASRNPQFLLGSWAKEGDLLLQIEDSRLMRAEIEVPETDILAVKAGAAVRLRLWGESVETLDGRVASMAPVAEKREFGSVVRVLSDIPNTEGRLHSGMTGYAKVAAREMPAWEAFSRLFVRFGTIEMWSWVP